MKTDEELQQTISRAIKQHKSLHDAKIGIRVKDGIVTLEGTVDCHFQLSEAEKAVKEIEGVKAVVQQIVIASADGDLISDAKIMEMITTAFNGHWDIPNNKLCIAVESGCVVLTGELDWNYQIEAAVEAALNLKGVKSISNGITLKS